MAEIYISTIQTIPDNSSILTNYYAQIEPSTDGRLTKELVLYIGDSTIRIWPVDADRIEQLAKKN